MRKSKKTVPEGTGVLAIEVQIENVFAFNVIDKAERHVDVLGELSAGGRSGGRAAAVADRRLEQVQSVVGDVEGSFHRPALIIHNEIKFVLEKTSFRSTSIEYFCH